MAVIGGTSLKPSTTTWNGAGGWAAVRATKRHAVASQTPIVHRQSVFLPDALQGEVGGAVVGTLIVHSARSHSLYRCTQKYKEGLKRSGPEVGYCMLQPGASSACDCHHAGNTLRYPSHGSLRVFCRLRR